MATAKKKPAPSPACGGGLGWGCRHESCLLVWREFPHPYRIFRCDMTSPASGRGERSKDGSSNAGIS